MPKDPLGAVSVSELNVGDFQEALPALLKQQQMATSRPSSGGSSSSLQALTALLRERRAAEAAAVREQRAEERERRAAEAAAAREYRANVRFQQQQADRLAKQEAAKAKEQSAQALANPPAFTPGEGYDGLPYSEQTRVYQEWLQELIDSTIAANPDLKEADLMAFRGKVLDRSPPPTKPKRSGFDLAADIAGGAGSGITQMVRSTLGVGLDSDNPIMQSLQSAADAMQPSSPVEQDRQKQIAFEMQQLAEAYEKGEVGPWRRFFEEAGVQVGNMSVGGIMELAGNVLPSLVGTGGVGLLARGAALRSGALAGRVAAGGAEAAQAVQAAARIGQGAAGVAGAAIEGASTGGEAGLDAYDQIMALSPEQLQGTEQWERMSNLLETDDPVRIQQGIAVAARTDSRWLAGSLGALLGGFSGVESMARKAVGRVSGRRAAAADLPNVAPPPPSTATRVLREAGDLIGEGVTEVVPTAVSNRAVLQAQGEDPSITDPRIYEGAGGDFILGVGAAGAARGGVAVAERLLGRGGEPDTGAPTPLPGTEAPAAAPSEPPPPGTTRQIGGSTVVMQPDGRWTYAPDSPQSEAVTAAIDRWNAAVEPAATPVEPAATPVEPVAAPSVTPPVTSTVNPAAVPPAAAAVADPADIEAQFEAAVAASPQAAQLQALAAQIEPLVREAQSLGSDPQVSHAVRRLRDIALQTPAPVARALAQITTQVLGSTQGQVLPTQLSSPLAYSALNLGLFQNAGTSPAAWARTVRQGGSPEALLSALARDPLAGAAHAQGAQAVLDIYRLTGLPLPAFNYYPGSARRRLGFYDPSTNRVGITQNARPSTVPHEYMHGLLRRAFQGMNRSAEGREILAVLQDIRNVLQAASLSENYYAPNAEYQNSPSYAPLEELIADLLTPDFLALAAQIDARSVLRPESMALVERLIGNRQDNASIFLVLVAAIQRILQLISPTNTAPSENSIAEALASIAADAINRRRTLSGAPAATPAAPTAAPATPTAAPATPTAAPATPTAAPAAPTAAPATPTAAPATSPEASTSLQAVNGLRALGNRVVELLAATNVEPNLNFRGIEATGALRDTVAGNAPLATKLSQFKRALSEGIRQLNAADQSAGINRQWHLTVRPDGRSFSVDVAEDGRPSVTVARGSYPVGAQRFDINTVGFGNLPSRGTPSTGGTRFYDALYGALVSANLKPKMDILTGPNQARMPINRLRAMLKWGAIHNDFARALRILTPEGARAQAYWGNDYPQGLRADAAFLQVIRAKVARSVGQVGFSNNSFTLNGQPISRADLNTAANAVRLSGDMAALAGLANALAQPGANARTIANQFISSQLSQGPMLFDEEIDSQPLPQAPRVSGATGPIPAVVEVARNYAAENGIPFNRQATYAPVNERLARRIADAYENMQHAPHDPAVREAYQQLIDQTRAQYDALVAAGFNFTFMGAEDPYGGNPWNAMRDLRQNKHMAVFPTEQGYGTAEGVDTSDHPLLGDSGLRWPDADGDLKPVLFNDLFRAVHDAFGHGMEGAGFRARGEENAWQAHARLFTGAAIGALTSETRGQNSWLSYGPHGDTNRTATLHDTVFADQKAGLMPDWTWTEGFDDSQDDGRLEDAEVSHDQREAAISQAMDAGITGTQPVSDPEFSTPRETFTDLRTGLETGRQSAPASIPRGIMQAIRRGDRKALVSYLQAGANELNDALHNALAVTERWLVSTAAPPAVQDRARHTMHLAPGRRDAMLAEANREHGGFDLQEDLRRLSGKHKVSLETIVDWTGRWASARYAEQRNQWLIKKLQREAEQAQTEHDRAVIELEHAREVGNEADLRRGRSGLAAARRTLRKANRTLRATIDAVFDPDPNIDAPSGPVAGYTNAQAAYFMQLVEKQIAREDLEKVAERLYDLNAWALTLDIESGRVPPASAANFIEDKGKTDLFNALRSAAVAYSESALTDSAQALESLKALRAQVAEAVRSQYVPLTGNPELSMEHDPFSAGVRQPNTTSERELRGRRSAPDDAVTATLGRLVKSASYAGWAPFQDAIADLYQSLTPEQREQAGIARDIVGPDRNPTSQGLVRRRGSTVEVFRFRDPKILGALQEYNRGADAVYSRILGAPSRWYAYMATQANVTFGVVNLARDAWERSEIIRGKQIHDKDGNLINSDKVARRLLSYSFNPAKNFELFAATMRFAFKRKPNDNSYADRMLQELSDLGGISVRGDTFSSSRQRLVKDASKSKLFTGIRDFIDGYNRMFDLLPLLASHMALREAGVTPQVAAAEALDLFNFRKRGKLTKYIAPMFAFAQTSFTGGANLVGTLYNPNSTAAKFGNTHFLRKGVVRILGTTVVFMAIQSIARALAGDDEGGNKLANVNRFIQDTNILLPIPGTDNYARVPLSFGPARVAHGMARNLLAVGHDEIGAGEALGSFLANNLNPVISPLEGTSIDVSKRPFQALMMVAAPSWAKPLAAVAQNRDSNDVPIVFDNFAKTDEYRSEQFGRNSAPVYKDVAKFLREKFGVDLAPEEVEHLIKGYPTGSFGHLRQMFVDNPHAEARGRPTSNPFASRFVGTYGDSGKLSQFYKGLEDSNEVQRQMNTGGTPDADDMRLLAWRSWWDSVDTELRNAARDIRRNKLLSKEAQEKLLLEHQNRRRQQQIVAVYRLRQAQGKPTEFIDVPSKL